MSRRLQAAVSCWAHRRSLLALINSELWLIDRTAQPLHRGSAATAGRVAVPDVCTGVRVSTHPHGHGPRNGLGPSLVDDRCGSGNSEHQEQDQDDDARGVIGRTS